MKHSCGTETEHKVFTTFEYDYCPKCKAEAFATEIETNPYGWVKYDPSYKGNTPLTPDQFSPQDLDLLMNLLTKKLREDLEKTFIGTFPKTVDFNIEVFL